MNVIAVLVEWSLGVLIVPDWSEPPKGVAMRTLSHPESAPYREIRGVLDAAWALQDDADGGWPPA